MILVKNDGPHELHILHAGTNSEAADSFGQIWDGRIEAIGSSETPLITESMRLRSKMVKKGGSMQTSYNRSLAFWILVQMEKTAGACW